MNFENLIRRYVLSLAAMLAVVLMTGCGDSEETAADQAEAVKETATEVTAEIVTKLTDAEEALVAKIAAIALAIEKAPATAGAVLEQNGLTTEEYEAAVYKIASNPALSTAFEKAQNP